LDALDQATRRLASAGIESARLDVELLMAAAAGVTREAAITGSIELSPATLARFDAMVARREKREPVAYILGHKEFHSLDFEVNRAVLIPRPESELVVGAALDFIASAPDARVLDIGTGSGAIAIAITVNAPSARVTAADISGDALAVSARNAQRLGVAERLTLRRADCFDVLDGGPALGSFDVVASNPPYLDDESMAALAPDVSAFEPRVAMHAGRDGLAIHRRIAAGAAAHLERGGELILEVADGQAGAVAELLAHSGLQVAGMLNDLAGHQRVIRAQKTGT
jgi:release factor glutamine methyltransferase